MGMACRRPSRLGLQPDLISPAHGSHDRTSAGPQYYDFVKVSSSSARNVRIGEAFQRPYARYPAHRDHRYSSDVRGKTEFPEWLVDSVSTVFDLYSRDTAAKHLGEPGGGSCSGSTLMRSSVPKSSRPE